MGYLDKFKWQKLITNPRETYQYRIILRDNVELRSEAEIRKEMKAKLSKEEYTKWWQQQYYAKNKEKLAKQYQDKRNLEIAETMATYHELYDDEPIVPNPRILEKQYIEQVKNIYRFTSSDRWRFSWWTSRIWNLRFWTKKYDEPVRICDTRWLSGTYSRLIDSQNKIYEYLKPVIDEVNLDDFIISDKQRYWWTISYVSQWRTREIMENWNKWYPTPYCQVASAMIRWRFIRWLPYLWRYCYIVWGMLCTEKWHLMLIQPWSTSWLTKDNAIEVANNVRKYFEHDDSIKMDVRRIEDCYLVRVDWAHIQNKKWEFENNNCYQYYVVPFSWLINS